jgi:chemotaxis protein histidine kinase CheA
LGVEPLSPGFRGTHYHGFRLHKGKDSIRAIILLTFKCIVLLLNHLQSSAGLKQHLKMGKSKNNKNKGKNKAQAAGGLDEEKGTLEARQLRRFIEIRHPNTASIPTRTIEHIKRLAPDATYYGSELEDRFELSWATSKKKLQKAVDKLLKQHPLEDEGGEEAEAVPAESSGSSNPSGSRDNVQNQSQASHTANLDDTSSSLLSRDSSSPPAPTTANTTPPRQTPPASGMTQTNQHQTSQQTSQSQAQTNQQTSQSQAQTNQQNSQSQAQTNQQTSQSQAQTNQQNSQNQAPPTNQQTSQNQAQTNQQTSQRQFQTNQQTSQRQSQTNQQTSQSQAQSSPWPLFESKVSPSILETPLWRSLRTDGVGDGCDFADVKFRLEFELRKDPGVNHPDLYQIGQFFVIGCPRNVRELPQNMDSDPDLKRAYTEYRAQHPRLGRRRNNPQELRNQVTQQVLRPMPRGGVRIALPSDPDVRNSGPIMGKVTASIHIYLDVRLPSLNTKYPDEERHILVLRSRFPELAAEFESTAEGHTMTLKPSPRNTIEDRGWKDIQVINYTCAKWVWQDAWPHAYTVGLLKGVPKAWARGTMLFGEFRDIGKRINDQRKRAGQEKIETVPRRHVRRKERSGSNDDDEEGGLEESNSSDSDGSDESDGDAP